MRAFEILWIVVFRFKPVARIWAILLILVNLASLLFLGTFYAWFNLVAVGTGLAAMILIYLRFGFVRLLGIGHILWIPMIAYFLMHLPDRSTDPALYWWVHLLVFMNSVSLIIDALDVARYCLGDRHPHYYWSPDNDGS